MACVKQLTFREVSFFVRRLASIETALKPSFRWCIQPLSPRWYLWAYLT